MTAYPRRVLLALAALAVASAAPTPGVAPLVAQSAENARYAAIVIDAGSGEVLFARHADSRRYPASITKVMTLYLVFDALADGRIKLTDRITVSPRAASQPPSKLGLAAGQTITVNDAIHSLAVRSANDMAVALAEHVGGSEARFTAQMTLKSEELGMTQSRWVNANGLPDSRQLTSARDLAILTRAVMRDFPQYYHYFGDRHWVYNGREYNNTNGLLHSGNGYDGIKTGYTNASGYNLAASAVRNGRRITTIVLGGRSSRTRNDHVAELMDTGFEVERLRAAGENIQIAQLFFEQRGYGIGSADPSQSGTVAYASLPAPPSNEAVGDEGLTAVAYTAAPAPAPAPMRVTPPPSAVRAEARRPTTLTEALNATGDTDAFEAPVRRTPSAPVRTPSRPAAERWAVQVGAFRDEKVARDWLTEVNRRFRAQFRNAETQVATAAGWYRSRFTGLSQESAEAACTALAERRVTCMVVRPD